MRYRVAKDEDFHWFLIPEDKFTAWELWCSEYPDGSDYPDWARPIANLGMMTFEKPMF